MYAIGGSAEPTINSQGNRYLAPNNGFAKEVIKLKSYRNIPTRMRMIWQQNYNQNEKFFRLVR